MAPNRKNVTNLLQSLSNGDLQHLQNSVQPKFLPLTDPKEEEQTAAQEKNIIVVKQQPQQVTNDSSASYWDWPADTEEEEKVVIDVLSLSNIQSNLLQAGASSASEHEGKQVEQNDFYWTDGNTTDKEKGGPQEEEEEQKQQIDVDYWSWPAEEDANKSIIDRILAEEKAYKVVSGFNAELIESSTKQHSSEKTDIVQVESTDASNDDYWGWSCVHVAQHTMDESHPNSKYWEWNADEQQQRSASSQTIQELLEYEAVRQMLTVDNVVKQIQSSKNVTDSVQRTHNQSADDYWSWSAEDYSDNYWDTTQQVPVAVASAGQGYWDW